MPFYWAFSDVAMKKDKKKWKKDFTKRDEDGIIDEHSAEDGWENIEN